MRTAQGCESVEVSDIVRHGAQMVKCAVHGLSLLLCVLMAMVFFVNFETVSSFESGRANF